ncbi:MAG: hypothetical protein ACOYMN_24525 [Roseimicrobium sp.]
MKMTLLLMVTAWFVASLQGVEPPKEQTKPFDLTTTLGETYKNCRIIKATPEALTIVHDGGVAKLKLAYLDDEWRKKFDYDPVAAREFAASEEEKRAAAEAKRAELARARAVQDEKRITERTVQEKNSPPNASPAAAAENTRLTPLAPLPQDGQRSISVHRASGSGSQSTSMSVEQSGQPVFQTEVVVPTVTPLGDPFSPTKIRSQTYILPPGYFSGGYPPYGYPPVYLHQNPPCLIPQPRTGVSGTISSGRFSIQINP